MNEQEIIDQIDEVAETAVPAVFETVQKFRTKGI